MIVGILMKWAAVAAVFMVAAAALPAVKVKSWGAAFGAALVFGVLNVVIGVALKFILKLVLFLPNMLTLGLVGLAISIVVNMALLKATDHFVEEDLKIEGMNALFTLAIAVSVASTVAGWLAH